MFETPVLFLVYNRPYHTTVVFDTIKKLKPKYLYISADGPNPKKEFDQVNCDKVKSIFNSIDWDCELKTLFRKENLGCRVAVSSAIDWFFNNIDKGIIIEDDILPDITFFGFCEQLLKFYEFDVSVMQISGTNVEKVWKSNKNDYFFSMFGGIWGWATWKRAWEKYNVDIPDWSNNEVQEILNNKWFGDKEFQERKKIYDKIYNNQIDTWDYQWTFYKLLNNGFSVVPSKNLISNIGFSEDALHTKDTNSPLSNIKRYSLSLPVKINEVKKQDLKYDYNFFSTKIKKRSIFTRILTKLKNGYSKIKR
jgi:hypothetical protein